MSRKITRELCMKLFYQFEMNKEFSEDILTSFIEENSHEKIDEAYLRLIYTNFTKNKEAIDNYINTHSTGWKIDRIAKVDLSILRVSVTEIIHVNDIPVKVSINEAIELSKKYCENDSSSFINGLLGSVVNDIER